MTDRDKVARAMFVSDGVCSEHDWENANEMAREHFRNFADAALSAMQGDGWRGFQAEVDSWMDLCFGETIKADRLERADRFLEEALELCQTEPTFTSERAHALVDYVFGRPVGMPAQEVGGVCVTLAALCNAAGIDVSEAAQTELACVWTKVDQIRAKQASKPTGSALPAPPSAPGDEAPAPPMPATDAELVERLRRKIDSGQRTVGGGSIDATGRGTSWGNEPVMVPANPDGLAAAARIEALTRPVEVSEAMAEAGVKAWHAAPDMGLYYRFPIVFQAMLAAREAGDALLDRTTSNKL